MFAAQQEGKDYSRQKGFGIGNEKTGLHHTIFGSVGASVNMLSARLDGDSAADLFIKFYIFRRVITNTKSHKRSVLQVERLQSFRAYVSRH